MEKIFHIVYVTKCIITKNWYIGVHSTNNLNDGYLGSGKRLKYSIKKYGIENHFREILFSLDNREDALKLESTMVRESTLKLPRCLNLSCGGMGGNFGTEPWNKGKKLTKQHKNNLSKVKKNFVPWNKGKKNIYSNEQKIKMVENRKIKNGYKLKQKYNWICPDGVFKTRTDDANYYNITPQALTNRVKSGNYPNFKKEKIKYESN